LVWLRRTPVSLAPELGEPAGAGRGSECQQRAPLPPPLVSATVGTPVNAVPLLVTAIPFTSPSALMVAVAAAEFPPPPAKPEQPRGFSRDEALTDPNSDSAVYLDTVEKWRDDMMQYNQLASQYEIATMRESYNEKLEKLEKVEQDRQHVAKQQQEMTKVRQFVNTNYDLGENVDDFITTMNDPKSINMDDLVGYYKWKKGVANVQQATPQTPIPASNSFRQVQRAQSVPQPMGVQPAQSNVPTNSDDNFMDAIVNSENNTNIL